MIHLENLYTLPIKFIIALALIQFAILGFDWLSLQYVTSTLADEVSKNGELTEETVNRVAAHLHNWTVTSPDSIGRAAAVTLSPDTAYIWGPADGTTIQRGEPISVGVSFPVTTRLMLVDNLYSWVVSEDTLILKSSFTCLSDRYIE